MNARVKQESAIVSQFEINHNTEPVEPVTTAPNTCFFENGFFAEIVVSDAPPRRCFHYVVQRLDSPEVLCCGQSWNYDDAERQVRIALDESMRAPDTRLLA